MSIVRTPEPEEATGAVAEIYANDLASLGRVPEHTRVVALNPDAYLAWEALARAISSSMGLRRYELVTLAAAKTAKSRHCRLAHGNKTLSVIDEEQLIRIARDHRDAGLTDAEVAMMDYAERVSIDATSISDADIETLRGHGFDDREIADIALAAAARNFFSRAIQALRAEVDVPPALSPELREALLEGL